MAWRGHACLPLSIVLCAVPFAAAPAERSDPDMLVQQDFQKRVAGYVKLRKAARAGIEKLKPTKSPETIDMHEHKLAHRIRELRRGARQGDIFTPGIAAEFRRLIDSVMQGHEAASIHQSLQHAEPVHLKALRINQTYPSGVPLQSTPPALLLVLPKLPPEMEYRVVGHALTLLDVGANLIVDFLPNAIP